MKLLLSLTINFGPIPSVHSLKSEMIIVLFLLVLCICSFSCNIMLEMVLHVEKSPKPFASALVSVLLAFIPLCFLEYRSNQNRSSGWHWLQQVSFCHTFPGIWSLQATVLLLIRVIQSQYRLGRSIFLVRLFHCLNGKILGTACILAIPINCHGSLCRGLHFISSSRKARLLFSVCLSSLVVASIFDNSTDWLWIENLIWGRLLLPTKQKETRNS